MVTQIKMCNCVVCVTYLPFWCSASSSASFTGVSIRISERLFSTPYFCFPWACSWKWPNGRGTEQLTFDGPRGAQSAGGQERIRAAGMLVTTWVAGEQERSRTAGELVMTQVSGELEKSCAVRSSAEDGPGWSVNCEGAKSQS